MTTFGFEIKLNNEKICRAGIGVEGVVTCNITSHLRTNDDNAEVSIYAGALNSVNNKYLVWTDKILKKGDRISIEIIDEGFDEPAKIIVADADESSEESDLEKKIKYFYRLKEELKEHLKE